MALVLQLSGGSGNTNPNFSLGGIISGTVLVDAVDENLYDDVTRKDVLVGKTEFRCFYIKNTSATPVHGATVSIDEFPVTSICTIGLDPVGSGDGTNTGVAQIISVEDIVPTGVTFEEAGPNRELLSKDMKLPLPTLKQNEVIAIWTKRISEEGDSESVTLGITATGNEQALPAGPGGEDFHVNDGVNLAGERTEILSLIPPFKVGSAKVGFSQVEA